MQREYLQRCFHRIPGRKHLIVGNHDKAWVRSFGWSSVQDIVSLKDGDQWFVLCHYPMQTWNHARRGAIQIFGHVHNNWRGSRNSVNVGVDVWDFQPMQAVDIMRRAKTLPVNRHWKDVEPGIAGSREEDEPPTSASGPRSRK